ncbi:MAG: ImmA/IrrE family metallo-endopeptidase [Patescibacteria group bacterium]|nr:ImmA/IrrE family metallo-endopeptidase [Patescibacteria group bacterium]
MREIVIEQKAILLLKKMNIDKVPVPLEEVAKMLNIRIGKAPNSELTGILVRKKNSGLIGVNSNDTYVRQRFTIAHEIGHYLLEKKEAHVDYPSTIYYRNYEDGSAKSDHEITANKFAAALLMPKNKLKLDFVRLFERKVFQEKDLEYLAEKYLVSKEAMRYRLVNLGLVTF